LLNRKQCRDADFNAINHFGIPGIVLMENAGRGCVERLLWHSPQAKLSEQAVLILCGPGNNGGDGFVMARHLYNARIPVKVLLFTKPETYSGDAAVNLKSLSRLRRLPVVEFDPGWDEAKLKSVFAKVKRSKTTWVVDALLGTGAKGEPRPAMAKALELANSMEVRRLAVDIPSGLDCDTGEASTTTFRAHVTCTFIDHKTGFENGSAEPFLGVVTLVGIGAPDEIIPS